jgi:hypothetical protein
MCISNDSLKRREPVPRADASSGVFVLYAPERQVDAWQVDAGLLWNLVPEVLLRASVMISRLP